MKKKIIFFLIGALGLTAGCNDFLDIRQENSVPVVGFDYSNPSNLFLPLSAAYASTRNGNAFAMPYFTMMEIASDNADKGSSPGDGADQAAVDTLNFRPANGLFNSIWVGYYDIISSANFAIEAMDQFMTSLDSPSDRQKAKSYRGEAQILRAFAYFNLVRLFGNIPIVDRSLTSEELGTLPQSTAQQVYTFIKNDLNAAIAVVPTTQPSEYPGRYTKYTACALKAKVHLYNNEFDSTAYYANQVIASNLYDLLPDFRTYFSVQGKNSKESLLEIQSSTAGNNATYLEYAYQQGPRNNKPSNMQGWGFCVPSNDLIKFYNTRGEKIRPATTLLRRGTVTPEGDTIFSFCENPVYNGKAYTPKQYNTWAYDGYGFNQNVRILRYADVLLMYAEALARGGAMPEGGITMEEAYNKVRTRAGMAEGTPTVQDIWDERRAEFAMEEDRFFDLIRTGQAQKVFAALELTFNPDKNNIYPIPTAQLDLNKNLKQNPGY